MPKKILIADDDQNAVEILKNILQDNGYIVLEAYDGETAVNKTKSLRPDLVLLDVTMPKLNGYAACKLIREDPHATETPIIMLTARDTTDDIRMALSRGADWYVSKPYDTAHLLEVIAKYFKTRKFT